jgi:hypothetical protein
VPVARRLRRAAGGVALDDVELGLRGVAGGAVGELAGQPGGVAVEQPLAAGELPGGLGGLAGLGGDRRPLDDLAALGLVLREPGGEASVTTCST